MQHFYCGLQAVSISSRMSLHMNGIRSTYVCQSDVVYLMGHVRCPYHWPVTRFVHAGYKHTLAQGLFQRSYLSSSTVKTACSTSLPEQLSFYDKLMGCRTKHICVTKQCVKTSIYLHLL